jgi:hypothetical protein
MKLKNNNQINNKVKIINKIYKLIILLIIL